MVSISMLSDDLTSPRLSARLYPENRGSPRSAAERPVTLRPANNVPIDAVVENLSKTGFGMSAIADLGVGSVVGLSVGGALRRRVRIVRRIGLAYGCEFLSPLSDLEVAAALRSGDVIAADFLHASARPQEESDTDILPPRKLSYLARAYILGGLIVSIWAVIVWLVVRIT